MRIGIKKSLLSIFLDFTTDGKRVKTTKEYEYLNGKRHISKISRIILDSGEVLEECYYFPGSKRPYASYICRPYMLN